MKALVYTANRELTYREESIPKLKNNQALVKVALCGICGSDMHAYLGHDERRIPPLILGHEAVGVVVEGNNIGQRVVINPLVTCGKCNDCLDGRQNICTKRDIISMYQPGAFAEYVVISQENLIPIPEDMKFEKAALTEPAATSFHAVRLAEKVISRPISELQALVIGSGAIGLLTALILQNKGVNVELHETNELRLEIVKKHTSCNIINPLSVKAQDNQYDIIFDAVGSSHTRKASIKYAKPGSTIVHIGLMDNVGEFDTRKITLQEITFIGCYTYTKVDFIQTLAKLYRGNLGNLTWTEIRPMKEGAKAFENILSGNAGAPKIVLEI